MLQKITNAFFLQLFKVPWVKKYWAKSFAAIEADHIPWTPLQKPLSQCKVGLVTTSGIHLKTDTPFNMQDPDGDASFRVIPSNANQEDLKITHNYYDHRDADRDLNVVVPLKALMTCQEEGLIGSYSENVYSFMGHIQGQQLNRLLQETAKQVAQHFKREQIDVAILSPA